MNVDPSVNIVAFEVTRNGKTEAAVGQGITRSPDCIQTVWRQVQRKESLRANQVVKIYSEWQPSQQDCDFIDRTFGDIDLSYSFERPASDDGWDNAIAEVGKIIRESLEKKAAEAPKRDVQEAKLLPVLRNSGDFSEIIVNLPLTPEYSLFLANVGWTPRGTIGIDYLMTQKVREGGLDQHGLWKEAFANLASGLNVNVIKHKGHPLFIVSRPDGLAAAAVGLPNFADKAEGWVKSRHVMIGIPDPGTVMVCAAESPVMSHVRDTIKGAQYSGTVDLTPCLMRIDNKKPSVQMRQR
jgi:hypothetical protein